MQFCESKTGAMTWEGGGGLSGNTKIAQIQSQMLMYTHFGGDYFEERE